jgi:hypothetical protein
VVKVLSKGFITFCKTGIGKKTCVFRTRQNNPIWRVNFPMGKYIFSFFHELIGLSLARHFFGQLKSPNGKIVTREKKRLKSMGTPDEKRKPTQKNPTSVFQIVIRSGFSSLRVLGF